MGGANMDALSIAGLAAVIIVLGIVGFYIMKPEK
jgi:hypothetical protein